MNYRAEETQQVHKCSVSRQRRGQAHIKMIGLVNGGINGIQMMKLMNLHFYTEGAFSG